MGVVAPGEKRNVFRAHIRTWTLKPVTSCFALPELNLKRGLV